jgi:transcriptional regulator with XRE-family HTH domain
MVNAYLPSVNAHLPRRRYVYVAVAKTKGSKRGPKKGVPKPIKRPLDDDFPERLFLAMKRRGFVREDGHALNSDLAKEVGCERATIGQYLNRDKPKRSIDVNLLLDLCDELWVTPYWLLRGDGTIEDVPKHKVPLQEFRTKARRQN